MIKDLTITSFLKSIFTFTLEINYTNATSVTKDSLIEVACEICGDGFISSNHLKRHMKMHSNQLPFACGTCKQAFSQRRQLVSHCNKVHGGNVVEDIALLKSIIENEREESQSSNAFAIDKVH